MGWVRGSPEEGVARPGPPPINPQATSAHRSQPHPQPSVTPQGKGVEGHTSGYLPGATPSLGHCMEGRTNRGTRHVYNDQAGAPPWGSSKYSRFPHQPPPPFHQVPKLLILWGPQEGRERSYYAKVGACARNEGGEWGESVGAGVPKQGQNLGVRQPRA